MTLSNDLVLAGTLYVALAGAYLLVIPLFLLLYLKGRWYTTGSVERTFYYALVFVFFPGMLLLSPFLNFRPQPRSIKG